MTDNGDWLKKYHEEHASYGGASHEFHARAQTWIATRDAEIAALRAEVGRLTAALNDAESLPADLLRETLLDRAQKAEADLARHKRALAAGPAALRATIEPVWGDRRMVALDSVIALVEAAQAEAMEEEM